MNGFSGLGPCCEVTQTSNIVTSHHCTNLHTYDKECLDVLFDGVKVNNRRRERQRRRQVNSAIERKIISNMEYINYDFIKSHCCPDVVRNKVLNTLGISVDKFMDAIAERDEANAWAKCFDLTKEEFEHFLHSKNKDAHAYKNEKQKMNTEEEQNKENEPSFAQVLMNQLQ